ncbi:hypothetical protein BH09PLA1_BH09PLA1_31710 [soil metagenome]
MHGLKNRSRTRPSPDAAVHDLACLDSSANNADRLSACVRYTIPASTPNAPTPAPRRSSTKLRHRAFSPPRRTPSPQVDAPEPDQSPPAPALQRPGLHTIFPGLPKRSIGSQHRVRGWTTEPRGSEREMISRSGEDKATSFPNTARRSQFFQPARERCSPAHHFASSRKERAQRPLHLPSPRNDLSQRRFNSLSATPGWCSRTLLQSESTTFPVSRRLDEHRSAFVGH